MNYCLRGALALGILLLIAPGDGWPQATPPSPEEVEAAYLSQFPRYVEFPSGGPPAGARFYICVLGTDPFGRTLDDIVSDKVIAGRPVVARRVLGPADAAGCQILFVSPSEEPRVPAILKALQGTEIMTVGRGAEFTRRGGMIAFTFENRRVRFVVNLAAAEAAGLELSSQLLRAALRVERSAP